MNKLYLLKNLGEIIWDSTRALVVCAKDETEARQLAASKAQDEGVATWLYKERSTCVELVPTAESYIVIMDVLNG